MPKCEFKLAPNPNPARLGAGQGSGGGTRTCVVNLNCLQTLSQTYECEMSEYLCICMSNESRCGLYIDLLITVMKLGRVMSVRRTDTVVFVGEDAPVQR